MRNGLLVAVGEQGFAPCLCSQSCSEMSCKISQWDLSKEPHVQLLCSMPQTCGPDGDRGCDRDSVPVLPGLIPKREPGCCGTDLCSMSRHSPVPVPRGDGGRERVNRHFLQADFKKTLWKNKNKLWWKLWKKEKVSSALLIEVCKGLFQLPPPITRGS